MLSAYASLHGKVERSLFARLEANKTGSLSDQASADSAGLQGEDPGFILKATNNAIKRELLTHYGLTGRQFNAISFGLKGKIAAITALRPEGITVLTSKIKTLKKAIKGHKTRITTLSNLSKKATMLAGKKLTAMTPEQRLAAIKKLNFSLHHKGRRVVTLEARLVKRMVANKSERISLCFGSKSLFHKQFTLLKSGYIAAAAWVAAENNLEARAALRENGLALWRKDWQRSRDNQFFVMGSGDETAAVFPEAKRTVE